MNLDAGTPSSVLGRSTSSTRRARAARPAPRAGNPLALSDREPWPTFAPRRLSLWLAEGALLSCSLLLKGIEWAINAADLPLGFDESADLAISQWHDRRRWPERSLRVGLVTPGAWADDLMHAPGRLHVDFFNVPGREASTALEHRRLDALVSLTGDGLVIKTLENPDRDAAWFDWSSPRPLSMLGVFPPRLDTARVSLGHDAPASLVRPLLELAAFLSRHEARLTAEDRFFGRRPAQLARPISSHFESRHAWTDLTERLALDMTRELHSLAPAPLPCFVAAAQLVSAWAATWAGGCPAERRAEAAGRAAAFAPCSPEVALRVVATHAAAGDRRATLRAVERAASLLSHLDNGPTGDTQSLLSSELVNVPGPETTGRTLVALCLLAFSVPQATLPYLREDLLDDLRHSSALRDNEHALNLAVETLRICERHRHGDHSVAA